jgi:hypothetical protein
MSPIAAFINRPEKWGFANLKKNKKKERDSTTFDNEDLSWMDLDPQTHQENFFIDVAAVTSPFGPGESSQARNHPVESTHVEDVDDDSES